MEKFNKIAMLVSALALSTALSGPATALTQAEIDAVASYTAANDVRGLRAFIQANPQLLEDKVLGPALQDFMAQPGFRGFFSALGFTPQITRDVRTAATEATPSLY
ncbi:MAG: hypothetical protein AAFQ66_02980 [Pseudomonadota bacterium]